MTPACRQLGAGRRAACLLLLGLATGLLAACRQASPRPNLVVVTLDTTRADRFGFAGHAAAATPRLDAFARERAAVFTDAVTVTPLTLPSHASLFTGTYPAYHGVHDNDGYVLSDASTTLAETFTEAGYATAAFVASFPLRSEVNLDQGFARYDDDYESGQAGGDPAPWDRFWFLFVERPADRVTTAALDWLAHPREPFFLWVHYFDPHAPYRPPPPYGNQFAADPYDGEIAFVDEQLGRLLDALEERQLLDHSLVVVAADHGESLFEHGEPTHSTFIYDATMKVPLLIAAPGGRGAGRRVEAQVSLVDVAPTVLELLGMPGGEAMQGTSLVPLLDDPAAPWVHEAMLESAFPRLHFGWAPLRALRAAGWKYVLAPKPELYDLAADPGERVNLAARQPEKAAEMERRLLRLERRLAAPDGHRSVAGDVDAETARRLAALGYIAGSARADRASPFPTPAQLAGLPNPRDLAPILTLRNTVVNLMALGRNEDAVAVARRGLGLDPDNPQLLLNLAASQAALGNLDKAVDALRAAALRLPGASAPHHALGRLLLAAGDPEAAVGELDLAHRLAPSDPGISADLASAQQALGARP